LQRDTVVAVLCKRASFHFYVLIIVLHLAPLIKLAITVGEVSDLCVKLHSPYTQKMGGFSDIDEDHLLMLHEAFSMFDGDGEGSIDIFEFVRLMESLGLQLNKMEALDMLREVSYEYRLGLRCALYS